MSVHRVLHFYVGAGIAACGLRWVVSLARLFFRDVYSCIIESLYPTWYPIGCNLYPDSFVPLRLSS